jgi:hypothetical protein
MRQSHRNSTGRSDGGRSVYGGTVVLGEAQVSELSQAFASAVSFVDYLATVPCHATLWQTRLRELPPQQIHPRVAAVPQPVSALVFAEPWCIDAVMNVPLLHRLSEVEPYLSARIAPLSKHPIVGLFPGRGGQPRIPTIVFFRPDSAAVEYWSERSRHTNAWFEDFIRDHPMPPLCLVDKRPGTPELEAWMALRFERASAAEQGGLWRATLAEWRDSIARLCEIGDAVASDSL